MKVPTPWLVLGHRFGSDVDCLSAQRITGRPTFCRPALLTLPRLFLSLKIYHAAGRVW
jgi:hypothetical protein